MNITNFWFIRYDVFHYNTANKGALDPNYAGPRQGVKFLLRFGPARHSKIIRKIFEKRF